MSGIGEVFAQTALSGPLVLAVVVAAVAGLVSFASPCVLPLVPGYLGYITGLTGLSGSTGPGGPSGPGGSTGLGEPGGSSGSGGSSTVGAPARAGTWQRHRPLVGAALFVAGFTAVFVSYGAAFGALGTLLTAYAETTTRALGVVVAAMGLLFLGAGRFLPARVRTVLDADRRTSWRPAAGLAGAPVLGVVFALGWSPCLGPTLAAVNALALDAATPWRGALLATAYAAGLGVPFLLAAAGLGRSAHALTWVRAHRVAIGRTGGALLLIVGLLLVTGVWSTWLYGLQAIITTTTLPI